MRMSWFLIVISLPGGTIVAQTPSVHDAGQIRPNSQTLYTDIEKSPPERTTNLSPNHAVSKEYGYHVV